MKTVIPDNAPILPVNSVPGEPEFIESEPGMPEEAPPPREPGENDLAIDSMG